MPVKVVVVVSLAFGFAALIVFSLTRPTSFESAVDFRRVSPGRVLLEKSTGTSDGEPDLDPLFAAKENLVTPERSLPAPEKAITSQGFAQPPSSLPLGLPIDVPDGIEMPWAWIDKLEPAKKAAVERAFDDAAAALNNRIPDGREPDVHEAEALMMGLEQEVATRLKSILSPNEFEAYLLSLPEGAQSRLGINRSGN
jgi:hypothetical protein